jgi:hypothetical protein
MALGSAAILAVSCADKVLNSLSSCLQSDPERDLSDVESPDTDQARPPAADLPQWLRGDPIAEHLRSLGRPVTRAAWLECAYGSSNEIVLEQDKETREWVRRHFPTDPNEPVA